MSNVKITCDSTCDLTPELYARFDVDVIPLGIVLGDDLKRDGVDVTVADLYDYVAKTGVLPKTSAISEGEYIDIWQKYIDDGREIVHINISSEISACHQNARLAATELGHAYPVDSRSLSTGSGILVLAAGKMAEEGLSAAEIAEKLEEMKTRIDCSFVLQTLEYLQKGGRCSSVLAFGANLLKLRPEILMLNGAMDVGKKYRGSAEKSITDYVKGRLDGRTDLDKSAIFVVDSYADPEIMEKIVKLVKEEYGFENVIRTAAGSTISSHCGAGTMGLMMIKRGTTVVHSRT